MMVWMFLALALILTLALGLSIGGLVVYRQGLWENIAGYILVGLMGIAISALSMLLVTIAIWPPYNAISFILTFGFIFLVIGVLYFVRLTNNTPDLTESE